MCEKPQIIVLDFGGQTANLIVRRVRELGVYSEIELPDAPTEKLREASGIILSGSPHSITDKNVKFNPEIFRLGIPLFGICYGHQLIAKELGGEIGRAGTREFGKAEMEIEREGKLLPGTPKKQIVWMSHYDQVTKMPKGFELLGKTEQCRVAVMGNPEKKYYGVQFHPEVSHTESGMEMIANFVFDVCKCKKNWSMQDYLEKEIGKIREKVGNKKVLLLASGGVDSTVVLAMLSRALPKEQIFALHVDTGFMRKNETTKIERALEELDLAELQVARAEEEFLKALKGVTDPEKKRKIIGKIFVDLTEREVGEAGVKESEWMLSQGTIYPDTIESAQTKHSDKIKTHHNRVEQIVKMIELGNVVEPLEQLYKDEVRALGSELGLSDELIWRQPFPGPGLAIRALCSNGKEKLTGLKSIEKKAKKKAEEFGFTLSILPVKSVGVQADLRTYAHPALLEGELNWEKLGQASTELTNEFSELNRVVYAVTPGKISKIKSVKADLNKKRLDLLREADAIAMEETRNAGLYRSIWQFPVAMLPLNVNGKGEAIVLRPIQSKEAMTAEFYRLDAVTLQKISEKIMKLEGIGAVFFDITSKPPATIEWE